MKKVMVIDNGAMCINRIKKYIDTKIFDVRYIEIESFLESQEKMDVVIISNDIDDFYLKYFFNEYKDKNYKVIVLMSSINNFKYIDAENVCFLFPTFEKIELNLRISVACKQENKISVGEVVLNKNSNLLSVGEKNVQLSKRECTILDCLMKNSERIISKETIYDRIIKFDSEAEFRIVTEYVYEIRKKLKRINCNYIKTIYGVGYKWCID